MNAHLTSFAITAFVAAVSASVAVAGSLPTDAEIEMILEKRLDTVGIVVGVIDENDSRVVGHGTVDTESGRSVDGKTIYEIGSITKVFTSLMLAEMIERGEVDLKDPIETFLPEGSSAPKRDGKSITLVDLATHTSSLPRLPDNLPTMDIGNPYADYDRELLHEFLADHELQREIGVAYEYSNLGAGLLGDLLAARAGLTYEELVVRRICRPLGMADTRITLTNEQRKRLATGHNAGGAPVGNWDFQALAGAGALRSTVDDMLVFLAANLGLTESKLAPAMQRMRQEWQDAGSPSMKIGLGWHSITKEGKTIVWHNGGTLGFHSFVGFDEENRRGVVVLSNSFNDIDDIGLHILDPSYELSEVEPPRKAIELAADGFADYVGEYELTPYVIFTVTLEDDQLFVQLTGQPAFPAYPESETKFFLKVVDAQITFGRDDEGKVADLTLHQAGVDQKARKRHKPGESLEPPREQVTVEAELLSRYVGEYELQPNFVITVRQDGDGLTVQATGQPAFPVFAESESRFFLKAVEAAVEFKVDEDGNVEGLTLFQGGQEAYGPKR